jgi:hypothetical protein
VYGNTERLATAMVGAVGSEHSVAAHAVTGGLTGAADADLLLIGGPTHAHGASGPLKDALHALPDGSLAGVQAAVFDTRFRMPRVLTGSAAGVAAKLLKRAGAMVIEPAESFFVTRDSPPQLDPGEEARAGDWAHDMVSKLTHA